MGELVATQPRHRGGISHAGLQAPGNLDQEIVAGGVAVCVVDELEIVDIEDEHGGAAPRFLPVAEGVGDLLLEAAPVGQPGQWVAMGESLDLAASHFLRRDVAGRAAIAQKDAGAAEDRTAADRVHAFILAVVPAETQVAEGFPCVEVGLVASPEGRALAIADDGVPAGLSQQFGEACGSAMIRA